MSKEVANIILKRKAKQITKVSSEHASTTVTKETIGRSLLLKAGTFVGADSLEEEGSQSESGNRRKRRLTIKTK